MIYTDQIEPNIVGYAESPLEFNYLETLAKTLFIPLEKACSFKATFWTMLQFVALLLKWKQTLHLQNRTLKFISGINNLILDKFEKSEEISHS